MKSSEERKVSECQEREIKGLWQEGRKWKQRVIKY